MFLQCGCSSWTQQERCSLVHAKFSVGAPGGSQVHFGSVLWESRYQLALLCEYNWPNSDRLLHISNDNGGLTMEPSGYSWIHQNPWISHCCPLPRLHCHLSVAWWQLLGGSQSLAKIPLQLPQCSYSCHNFLMTHLCQWHTENLFSTLIARPYQLIMYCEGCMLVWLFQHLCEQWVVGG